MPLEHFEADAAIETNDAIRKDGLLCRHGRLGFSRLDSGSPSRGQREINVADQAW
jgi:hypothetical protein